MSKRAQKKAGITAADLMQQLRQDPAYKVRLRRQQELQAEANDTFRRMERPIIDELVRSGYNVASLDELRTSGKNYRGAVPILLKALRGALDPRVMESIVRTLSVPWAPPEATNMLLDLFVRIPERDLPSLKWAIGNALEVLASRAIEDGLVKLARERWHGKAREMVVVALAKLDSPNTERVLIELLGDEQVAGHAVLALSRRPGFRDRAAIEPFLRHPQGWVREAAQSIWNKRGSGTNPMGAA